MERLAMERRLRAVYQWIQEMKRLITEWFTTSMDRGHLLTHAQSAVVVTILVAITMLMVLFASGEHRSSARETVARGVSVSGLLAESGREALATGDRHQLLRLVIQARSVKGLLCAQIVDRAGKVLGSTGADQPGLPGFGPSLAGVSSGGSLSDPAWRLQLDNLGLKHWDAPNHDLGGTIHLFQRPINSEEETLGYARVAVWTPGWRAFLYTALRRAGLGLVVSALLLLVGHFAIARSVAPITKLKEHSGQLAGLKEWRRLEEPLSGEAGEIARNWNAMVANFEGLYDKLTNSNRDLQVTNRVILYEKRRRESIVEALPDGVLVTDVKGRVVLVNHEFEKLLRLRRDDVLGRPVSEVWPEEASFEPLRQLFASRGGRQGRRTAEIEWPASEDGRSRRRVVRATYGPIRLGDNAATSGRSASELSSPENGAASPPEGQNDQEANGQASDGGAGGESPAARCIGGITTFRDVTHEKLQEESRRDFVSNVTHELRAPLSSIKSYSEMLMEEWESPEEEARMRTECYNTIKDEIERLEDLISNMLNISRVEMGGLVIKKASVRMKKLLEETLSAMAPQAAGKGMKLEWDVPEDFPDLKGDKDLLKVVVTNLLSNALKYTQEGGSVTLIGEKTDEEVLVHVVDTGCGIPEDERSSVFQKFYRGRETGQMAVKGSGLGLALAREIAGLHGGDLRLESEVGQGSKFSLVLPAPKRGPA